MVGFDGPFCLWRPKKKWGALFCTIDLDNITVSKIKKPNTTVSRLLSYFPNKLTSITQENLLHLSW